MGSRKKQEGKGNKAYALDCASIYPHTELAEVIALIPRFCLARSTDAELKDAEEVFAVYSHPMSETGCADE